MSSKNNDEAMGFVFVIAFIGTVAMLIAAAIFALAAFAALVLTVLCLFAWNDGLTIGEFSIEAHEARAFIVRGILGTIIAPTFTVFCALLFGVEIDDGIWPYIFIGGYTAGSVGVEYLLSQQQHADTQAAPPIAPPLQITPPPAPAQTKHPCVQANCPLLAATRDYSRAARAERPFQFASWDDEEVPR